MPKVIKAGEEIKEETGLRPFTLEDTEVALDGPAFSINRSLLSIGPSGVRIAFIEGRETVQRFRTAVNMSPQDAIALKDALTTLLKEVEAQIIKAEEDAN